MAGGRIIGSFNHGSMANAMLHAIGAQTAYPNRQVISMSGDGGFTMMMGDFITLIQMGLPVKVIVLNNGTLGFVEMEMKASGFLDTGCDLKNPNFALMAQAMGVQGFRVEKPQELKERDRSRPRAQGAGAGRRRECPARARHAAKDDAGSGLSFWNVHDEGGAGRSGERAHRSREGEL